MSSNSGGGSGLYFPGPQTYGTDQDVLVLGFLPYGNWTPPLGNCNSYRSGHLQRY